MAQIVDRVGVEIVSVGDTVGHNLWGQPNPLEVTMDQMITVTQAVRRGVKRALVSVDFPFGPVQEGVDSAVKAAIRMVKEAGVDTFLRYHHEQGLSHRQLAPEDMFAPETMEEFVI